MRLGVLWLVLVPLLGLWPLAAPADGVHAALASSFVDYPAIRSTGDDASWVRVSTRLEVGDRAPDHLPARAARSVLSQGASLVPGAQPVLRAGLGLMGIALCGRSRKRSQGR